MVDLGRVPQGLELSGRLVEGGVIDGSSAGSREGEVSQGDAAQVPKFAILRQQERAFGLGRHCFMSELAQSGLQQIGAARALAMFGDVSWC